MKIVVKIIAGLLITGILVIVGYFVYKLYKNDFSFAKTFGIGVSEKLVEEKELDNFKELYIDFNTSNVEIKHSEDNKFKISIYSDREGTHSIIEDVGVVRVVINEKKLKFKERLFNHKISRVLVYIPKDYEGKININGDVGDIDIDNYQYALLSVKLNVGDVYIDGIKSVDADLDVGNLKIKKTYSDFKLKVNTGDIRIKEATALVDSTINVDVGNVKIEETNDILIKTISDVGKTNVEKNNLASPTILLIEVKVGKIDVLAPQEEKKS